MSVNCPYCPPAEVLGVQPRPSPRFGSFTRSSDQCVVQRFICLDCRRTFSDATFDPCYGQNKRQHNPEVCEKLCDGLSQRRIARRLKIHRKTVDRKIQFLARMARYAMNSQNFSNSEISQFQFDDMEATEHTKCKPLSITIAVEPGTRRILGLRVSQMPAKGLLAKISRKKYGPRKDFRPQAREDLFNELRHFVTSDVSIKSDMNPHYPKDVSKHFPNAQHSVTKGRRGCVVGQGELKRGGWDPLFSLNHTCASIRCNIKRMVRRNWTVTKRPDRLASILLIYTQFHNEELIKNPAR